MEQVASVLVMLPYTSHNLGEVIDAVKRLDSPNCHFDTIKVLLKDQTFLLVELSLEMME